MILRRLWVKMGIANGYSKVHGRLSCLEVDMMWVKRLLGVNIIVAVANVAIALS